MVPFDSTHHAQTVWNDVVAYIKQLHSPLVRQWFSELEPMELSSGVLSVRCSTAVQQQYLAIKCRDVFNEAAQAATGKLISVNFTCGSQAAGQSASMLNMYNDGVISPDYVFENFVTGPTNDLAYASSHAVAERPGKAYNPLFIHGAPGLGKTHLLQATCQEIFRRQPDTRILFLSCESFINCFMESVQAGDMMQFRNRFRNSVDVLVIDDIHFLTRRDRTQEEFFHTFNALFQLGKQIILSSDSPPHEIPELENRLVSRFSSGLVARIDRPCFETRVAIVKTKSRIRGIALADDVVNLIAGRIDTNIRELEGAITKIQGYAMLNGGKYDMETAMLALGDTITPSQRLVSIQAIIDQVTRFYNVRLADLQSKRRHKSVTLPRQVCMYLARQKTRLSLMEIGGYFGGRDHTTVMHSIKAIEELRTTDVKFADHLSRIEMALMTQVARAG
ncbi:MAG: chromosomal replication initiator protein DnaA [Phycisphaerae bacterium]